MIQAMGRRDFQPNYGMVLPKEREYFANPGGTTGSGEVAHGTKEACQPVPEVCDVSLASTVEWINAAREKRRKDIRENLLITKMPGDVTSVIIDYLPTSSYPPRLCSRFRAHGGANEKTKSEVRGLMQGSTLDSSTYHITSVLGNVQHLHVAFRGPENTSSSAILFQVEIFLPVSYPDSPPLVRYLTKVDHKDIDSDGTPDLSMLMGRWCDTYNIALLLMALRAQLLQGWSKLALTETPSLRPSDYLQLHPMHVSDDAELREKQQLISPLYKLPLERQE
mmetsp:Transcript_13006/g.24900  ORF Transcript_13006/g.24900 Transcript_13006/m.24900 type:complete len:279 (-) Transcript_13006:360-1196(-)